MCNFFLLIVPQGNCPFIPLPSQSVDISIISVYDSVKINYWWFQMSVYGKRIAELREKAGLEVNKLAFRCKWKRSRLSNYELGIRTPGIDEVLVIAGALKPFLGDNLEVYIFTGEYIEKVVHNYTPAQFTVSDATKEFSDIISDAVDYGRIQLEPSFKVADLIESFSKACGSYLDSNGGQKAG